MDDLTAALKANPYPGRGLVCAGTAAGTLVAYFVTGRSAASKQREIRRADDGRLLVKPLGEGADDPLRHYAAAVTSADWLVCGNGRQVDTVLERLAKGQAPEVALGDLEHEPDEPIFTDRITVVVSRRTPVHAVLGAARRSAGVRTTSDIHLVSIGQPAPGDALLLSTYFSDGETIEGGRPFLEVSCPANDAEELLDAVWAALDSRFRVAAMVVAPARGLDAALIRNEAR
jgi:IMP cyclohydrolase